MRLPRQLHSTVAYLLVGLLLNGLLPVPQSFGGACCLNGDIVLDAGRNVTLASASNETHSYNRDPSGSKKSTRQSDHIQQQAGTLSAGGKVVVSAGHDITLVASKISAGGTAYLVAGNQINLLAANDSDYSLYDMKKKGSWGKKKTQHDETTVVKAIGSGIEAGGGIRLVSGGDQHYQGANLKSGDAISVYSGGKIYYEAVKDTKQSSHDKSSSSLAWNSAKGKGKTNETLRQTEMLAQNGVAIHAVEGLQIDYKNFSKKSVSQAIDAMVKADPGLAWIKEAEARGDVDWRAVKEIHDSYKYSNSGLGAAPSLAIAIVAAAYLGPVYGPMASNLAIGTINNGGDIGRGLKYAASPDNLKSYAIAAATAYMTSEYFDKVLKTKTNPTTGKVTVDLSSVSGVSRFAANQALQNVTTTALSKTAGLGGSFGDALKDSLYNTFAAAGFNAIGDFGKQHGLNSGDSQMVVMHALMGGLAAQARGDSFAAGAAAAGLNEYLVADLDKLVSKYSPENREALLTMSSQLVGLVGTVLQNPSAGQGDLEAGAWAAKNSTQYNWLLHEEIDAADAAREGCAAKGGDVATCQRNITQAVDALDQARNLDLMEYGRAVQLMAYQEQWTPEQYQSAMLDYWKGLDRSQVTTGYAPAQEWQYIAGQMGSGFANAAVTWPGRAYDSVINTLTHLTDIPQNIVKAGGSAVDWLNSPIPAQSIERIGDQLQFATPDKTGGIVFDLAAGTITSTIGGKAVEWIGGKWVASSAVEKVVGTPDPVQAARQRQAAILEENQGYNVSPISWDNYPNIGRNGTYITDKEAISSITGPLNIGGETVITKSQAAQLELAMGLKPGSMASGFKVRQVDGVAEMSPYSPLQGNEYFQGAGKHLPGGGPEMVVESIQTIDSGKVKVITTVIVK